MQDKGDAIDYPIAASLGPRSERELIFAKFSAVKHDSLSRRLEVEKKMSKWQHKKTPQLSSCSLRGKEDGPLAPRRGASILPVQFSGVFFKNIFLLSHGEHGRGRLAEAEGMSCLREAGWRGVGGRWHRWERRASEGRRNNVAARRKDSEWPRALWQ